MIKSEGSTLQLPLEPFKPGKKVEKILGGVARGRLYRERRGKKIIRFSVRRP